MSTPDELTYAEASAPESDRSTRVHESWLGAYIDTNRRFPMAPAATDTSIGAKVLTSVIEEGVDFSQVLTSKFDSSQLEKIGRAMTLAHLSHGVQKVTDENVRFLKKDTQLESPHEAMVSASNFQEGWGNIKERIFKAILGYIDGVSNDEDLPKRSDLMTKGEVRPTLTPENAARIDAFMKNTKYEKERQLLLDMYKAADTLVESTDITRMAMDQRGVYDLKRGGQKSFTVTEQLSALIDMIDDKVTSVWEASQFKDQVPEKTKTTFIDVITRRKDQPVS